MQTASSTPQANVLRIGRVVKSYPDKQVVDVVFLDDGGFASGVGVSTQFASQEHGFTYLPDVEEPADGHWSVELSESNDALALVGYFGGMPFVTGFVYPATNKMGQQPNTLVIKHVRGSSIVIDGSANITMTAINGQGQGSLAAVVMLDAGTGAIQVKSGSGANLLVGVSPGKIELNP